MKRKLVRELALISLPLAFIGAAAWLLAGNGRVLLPARFDNGPLRLETSDFKEVKLSPAEVYEGFAWAATTSVQERGKSWDAPASLRSIGQASSFGQVRVVYRKGTVWKVTPKTDSKGWSTIRNSLSESGLTLMVKLEKVPPDAEEVRLRGHIESTIYYQGVLPAGAKVPTNFSSAGTLHELKVRSKPFDLVIKSPAQPMPKPLVSHESNLEFVAAGWYYKPNIHNLLVRFRHHDATHRWSNLRVFSYSLRDGDGKEVILTDGKGKPQRINNFLYIYRNNYPGLPENEAIFDFTRSAGDPARGWASVKQPISLDALVTDGTSWPLRIRSTVSRQVGDEKTLADLTVK